MGKGSQEVPETEAEKANAQVAMEQWQMYQDHYRPTELKFIGDVIRDQTGMKQVVAGKVNADLQQKVRSQAMQGTVDPNRIATSRAFDKAANVQAGATADATQMVDNKQLQGKQAIVDMGMGKAAQAQQGFANIATNSVREALSEAEADRTVNDAYASATMTALGAGARMGQQYFQGANASDTAIKGAFKNLDTQFGTGQDPYAWLKS